MLAKTVFQPQEIGWMYRPFASKVERHPGHSYRVVMCRENAVIYEPD